MKILDLLRNLFNRRGGGTVQESTTDQVGVVETSAHHTHGKHETKHAAGHTDALSSEMSGVVNPGLTPPVSEQATSHEAVGLVNNPTPSTPAAEQGLAQAAAVASPNGLPLVNDAPTYGGFPGGDQGGSYGGFPSTGSYDGFPGGSYGGFPVDGSYAGFPDSGSSYGGFPDGTPTYTGFPTDGGSTASYSGFPDGSSYSTNPMSTDSQDHGMVVSDFTEQKAKPQGGWADTSAEKPQDLSGGVMAAAGDDSRHTDPLEVKSKHQL